MTTPHYIPETARLFLIRRKPHHALAAVVVLAITQSIGVAAAVLAIASF